MFQRVHWISKIVARGCIVGALIMTVKYTNYIVLGFLFLFLRNAYIVWVSNTL